MKNPITKSIIALALLLTVSFSLQAKIYYVKQSATGDGTSWDNAAGDIQAMIDKSVSGDQVWVAKGNYYPTTETIARDARSRSFVTKVGVPLCGGFAGTETSLAQRALADLDSNGRVDSFELVNTTLLSGDIDGVADVWNKTMNTDGETWKWTVTGNEGNCYQVVNANSKIDGFSVIGGNYTYSVPTTFGGGIYSSSSVTNCMVSNCSTGTGGGGIFSSSSVTNCMVSNCKAGNGGGISASTSVTNCTVSNCSAGSSGGGIYSYNFSYVSYVTNCTVSNCRAGSTGGGIYSEGDDSYSYVINCTVSNCSAGSSGGGISSYSYYYSKSYITNCTVGNCSAGSRGGGIYSSSSPPSATSAASSYVTNCTVSNCSADSSGGGISSSRVMTCAVSNNKVGDTISDISGSSGNISPDILLTYVMPTSFVGVATTDTQKAELIAADWHLRKGSPCINAGTSTNVLSTILTGKDFDGNPRVLFGIIDIGAYEYSIPKVALPVFETFDSWLDFDKSEMLYSYSDVKTGLIKWSIENQKAVFSWKTNLITSYSQPFFTYQIDGRKVSKVYLRYDMYFQPYAGTITPLGTEKLNVEYSADLVTWSAIASYSNANGTIANQTYKHDISTLAAGKTFYIRFNANGQNSNRIEKWEIDNIIVDTDGLSSIAMTKVDKLLCHVSNGLLAIRNIKEGSSVQLYDVNGQLVAKQLDRDNAANIALPHRGVYLVKVKSGNEEKSEKVVW